MKHPFMPALLIAGGLLAVALIGEALHSGPRRAAASEHYYQSLRLFSIELDQQGRRQQFYHALYNRPSHLPEHWDAQEYPIIVAIWEQITRDFSPGPEHMQLQIPGPEEIATFPMPRGMSRDPAYAGASTVTYQPDTAISILATVMNDPISRHRSAPSQ